ncbi:MAG: hypothetical protein KA084_01155 [Brachymonas sp.]|nr:hypothetical protein [Brachymonas sp.]MBP7724586.1 hypothetical protein [Brachymonas sp.]MBP7733987.1 hypothetical protein [Brachymonas sp.]MBP7743940.1 hypothetical protein [Brachymonas sp.]
MGAAPEAAPRGKGNSVCGNVARPAASGAAGKYKAPFCPHATNSSPSAILALPFTID